MRKFVLAFCSLFFAASAHAHVSAVLFPEVGSLRDAHKAAFFMPQTYLPPAMPQITCAMATGAASVGGPCTTPPALGVCNGDVISVTRNITTVTTPSPANKNLNVSVNTFASGDVGKTIIVPGIGAAGDILTTTISAFVDAQNVTMANAALTAVTGASTSIIYGTDDAFVFAQFNVWALANQGTSQVVQNFGASSSCWFGTQQGGGAIKWVAGIKNLLVEGNNSTLDGLTVGWYAGDATAGTGSSICHKGLTDASGCTARIQTVSAGASQIALTAASFSAGYISRFSVNQWILLAGLNPQEITNPNGSGYPPNPSIFEWRQITAICNNTGPCSGGATLTLNSPLTYSYLSTWPNYSSGNSGEADGGGPATIYAMGANWNTTVEYKNLTIKTVGQLNGSGRFVTYRNVSFAGSVVSGPTNNCGAIPSQNDTWSAYSTNWGPCTIETDKITSSMVLDTVTANRVDFQSSSITNLTMPNSTIGTMIGTAQNNTITDTSFTSFRPGSNAYGNTNKVVCTRCNVTSFDGAGGGILQNDSPTFYSMSGGVISFLNSDVTGSGPPNRVFAPMPTNVFYVVAGSFAGTIGLFNAQTITQDPTNTFVQTNEAGGFPTFSGYANFLRTHPAQQFTCDACTGDPIFVATNIQLGATALKPLAEFSKRTFTPTVQTNNIGDLLARGKLVSLTIDVTTASTSSGSPTLNVTGSAHQETVKQSNWTAYDWVPTINLKQAGKRVITPSGTTCDTGGGPVAGACAGDTCTLPASGCYTLPEAVWIKETLGPGVFGTFNGTNPTFTIEIKTNQGVVP